MMSAMCNPAARLAVLTAALLVAAFAAEGAEFRGAWLHTVKQESRFTGKTPAQCRAYLTRVVDNLKTGGITDVFFQIRSEGDAFYPSPLEPWSRFLTGVQGKSPAEAWDPLKFMIDLAHRRGMKLHAWLNPYRMSVKKGETLAATHLYRKHPEWFVAYNGLLYLDPGLPESREWIRRIVKDVLTRYEVDGIHFDDYFYPYPEKGCEFDDRRSFARCASGFGVTAATPDARGEFRRRSVDALIRAVAADVRRLKPKARFGVSPFGIYRNRKKWAGGSDTDGLQCYDDLYADVLKWAREGWVDYLLPQLYWEIGHARADYSRLCRWWAANTPARCRLYIGIDIARSLDGKAASAPPLTKSAKQFTRKFAEARQFPNVGGFSFWYGYLIDENAYQVRDFLKKQ